MVGTAIPQEGFTSKHYAILGRLGSGGMADIYLARASSEGGVDRYVVLKRVLAERARDPQFAKMFIDEARLAAQLQHPNIAQVHDIGTLGGSYFFTMEYVHGEDIRAVLEKLGSEQKQMPVSHALFVAAGALAALHHAHDRAGSDGKPLGVVHRDVSPANVMVSYEGAIKLLDFGVAKASQRSSETKSGTIKGKISYLSPEQCQCKPIDRRSDIFALGIVLHEMLTGDRLFTHDSDFNAMLAIVSGEVDPPSKSRPEIPLEVDEIVLKALDKDPDRRFATAADMLEAIETVAAEKHYVMSGTAIGRFLRELFGERPEPWIELATKDPEPRSVTVTDQAIMGLDVVAGEAAPVTPGGSPIDRQAETAVQAQLDRAPALRRTNVTMSPVKVLAAVPRSHPSVPARSGRGFAIVGGLVVVAAVASWIVIGRLRSDDHQAPPTDGAVAVAVAAAPVDAVTAPDVKGVEAVDAAAPASLADAITRADWAEAIRICGSAQPKNLSVDDRTSCGIAACSAKQRSTALIYHRASAVDHRRRIERACREQGITLVTVQTQPKPPDPCETNPMRCQK